MEQGVCSHAHAVTNSLLHKDSGGFLLLDPRTAVTNVICQSNQQTSTGAMQAGCKKKK